MINYQLEKEIVKHIYNNFVLPSNNILNNNFIIYKFNLYENSLYENKIYGISTNILNQKFNIYLSDVSESLDESCFIMFINIENVATYALYIMECFDEFSIFVKSNDKWIHCNTYLQSTFLSGMEQLREIGFYPQKINMDSIILNDIKSILHLTNDQDE